MYSDGIASLVMCECASNMPRPFRIFSNFRCLLILSLAPGNLPTSHKPPPNKLTRYHTTALEVMVVELASRPKHMRLFTGEELGCGGPAKLTSLIGVVHEGEELQ